MDTRDQTREVLLRRHARYEVSPYFVLLDRRTFGVPPSHRRIQAGFDVDLYGNGFDHGAFANGQLRSALDELSAVTRAVVAEAAEHTSIEIIPFAATLVINVKSHFEPEALVRIRIAHTRGLDQPAGASEEKALASVVHGLNSLGARKT